METWLDSEEMIHDFFLERVLPGQQTGWFAIENICIPLVPNAPCSNHNNLHEIGLREVVLSFEQFIMNVKILSPSDSKSKPPADRRGAVEKEMNSSFLNVILTQNTVIAFLQELFPSSKHIPCIEPIIEQQPCKEPDFRNTP